MVHAMFRFACLRNAPGWKQTSTWRSVLRQPREQRGTIHARRVREVVANLPRAVGERELNRFAARTHWDSSGFSLEVVPNPVGPGNVLIAEVESEHVTEVFTGFGEKRPSLSIWWLRPVDITRIFSPVRSAPFITRTSDTTPT